MITWIVGQGGLLGNALARRSGDLFEPGPIPWHNPSYASNVLFEQAKTFAGEVNGEHWRVIWAAGSATTSTSSDQAVSELVPLEGLLHGIRESLPHGKGSFFLTSSAGGVYAGAEHPPFTSATLEAPLSPYGQLKLAQEALAREALASMVPVILGRVSNLYGPGQNLNKLQGLISHLARAAVTRQPVNIFVPLQTTRDYITADDAAAAILAVTEQRVMPGAFIEIIATGRGTTIGQLLRTMNDVAKRKVPVALGTHPSAPAQASDLRLAPTMRPPQITPLPAGMRAVFDDILVRSK